MTGHPSLSRADSVVTLKLSSLRKPSVPGGSRTLLKGEKVLVNERYESRNKKPIEGSENKVEDTKPE